MPAYATVATALLAPRPRRVLRIGEVAARIGVSKSTIYVRIEQGDFPRPIDLGGRSVGWLESDVEDWIRRRPRAGADTTQGEER